MARWEYKTVEVKMKGWLQKKLNPDEVDETLNELGRQGWELVNAEGWTTMQGATCAGVYTFKRPLA